MHTRVSSRLSGTQRKELMIELCRALSTLKTPQEIADALLDLLTPKEVEMIAKRLKIADLLVQGKDYHAIRAQLNVGYSTIAKVNTKRRYSKNFWPQLVPEEFLQQSDQQEKDKITHIMEQFGHKHVSAYENKQLHKSFAANTSKFIFGKGERSG